MENLAAGEARTALAPAMTAAEVKLYRHILLQARRIIEFGAGGSTLLAVQSEARRIDTVESSTDWVKKVSLDPQIQAALSSGRLRVHWADIGPVKELGFPADETTCDLWPSYHQEIWSSAKIDQATVILVDGRFRVACAASALLRARPDTMIVIHDFWNRPYYHPILNFVDHVASEEKLAVLRPRKKPDRRALTNLLERHWTVSW